jgi:hypothetical protein
MPIRIMPCAKRFFAVFVMILFIMAGVATQPQERADESIKIDQEVRRMQDEQWRRYCEEQEQRQQEKKRIEVLLKEFDEQNAQEDKSVDTNNHSEPNFQSMQPAE